MLTVSGITRLFVRAAGRAAGLKSFRRITPSKICGRALRVYHADDNGGDFRFYA
jgi:hypothetical protein